MKAVQLHRFGDPSVLELADLPTPEPIPTEVLVRTRAAGVNPVDWKTRSGSGVAGLVDRLPMVLGWDTSGVVEAVGPGVTRFSPGDEVFGMPRFPYPAGAYAQYLTSRSRQLARKPPGLSHEEAAGLPLAGLTAWQTLVDTADVRAGQRVLVHAAAGGVGHLAVQIAKARGAYVIGTARRAKHALLDSLGVDEAIDYTDDGAFDTVHDVDVVVDLVGGETGLRSLEVLRTGGTLVSVPSATRDEVLRAASDAGVRASGIMVEPDGHALESLAGLVEEGRLRVEIEAVFSLEKAKEAHELGETGRAAGKIVLEVD